LNRVGTKRQERVIREAIALVTSVPVLGAIPRLSFDHLPPRHLGLVMPNEREDRERALDLMGDAVELGVDVEAIHCLAEEAPYLVSQAGIGSRMASAKDQVRIGILRDDAFSFYYPENLAALVAHGAQLVPISPLRDAELPAVNALYAGGGYPEEHAAELSGNTRFRQALAARIAEGLPVWAECGGLMYLASALVNQGERYPMVGALPIEIEQTRRPQAHGYVEARVDGQNPFLSSGTQLRGHEFHFSRVTSEAGSVKTVLSLQTGVGIGGGRDGLVVGNVFASYLHLFAPGAPEWAPALVRAAREARALGALTQTKTGDHRGIHYSSRFADRNRRGWVHSRAY
jgi:cobyrinic acid a,c-diamide synthase